MNKILTEKEYQHFIMDKLQKQGYIIRSAKNYDSSFAMDKEILFEFLNTTQKDTMKALQKFYPDNFKETIIHFINSEITKVNRSLIDILNNGINIKNKTLYLMYTKPATSYNQSLVRKYEQNIFSVMEEVSASDKERIDLVIFLNGLAIISFELKCNMVHQDYHNAIMQYRLQRNPLNRLFLFKAGCLVNFAMDLQEVYMTTMLNKKATIFLPFNKGSGEGINSGAGNPICADKFGVAYMWEEILVKDTLLDLISKFIFIDKKGERETLIFPRYHQFDVIRKLLADVKCNHSSRNYLIQHSAGSGKTNSIAWLAHRLSSLHDSDNKIIFDNIIIVTDRVVIDRQLQHAVMAIKHQDGLIAVMDDNCTSADLAKAICGNTKIIVTTIQKFPYIVDTVSGLKQKKFAVIIDEAHSSTAGKNMMAVTKSLGSDENEDDDVEAIIENEIRKNGKQDNISMFAFTATPKATTLQLFGRPNDKGQYEAFHIYSMKQAIEEGFILDVLQNYTCYETFYQLHKTIQADPRCNAREVKRKIARYIDLHEENIAQRVEIIVEHFRQNVMYELAGKAKAMIVTSSRASAVKYYQAFCTYLAKYTDMKAIVAFSGKVKLSDEDTEYSEASLNHFSEDKLTHEFNKLENKFLIVANKYQTGFDQPKLCAMYILKNLQGINAVQTLSRLNRICLPYAKKTFILDFVNSYNEMTKAFEPYYTTTLLSNSVTPDNIYNLEAKITKFAIMEEVDIKKVNEFLYREKISMQQKQQINFYLQKVKERIEAYEFNVQREIIMLLRRFVRYYEFLLQVSNFEDIDLHQKYNFITYVLSYVDIKNAGNGFDLDGKIQVDNFVQKKIGEYEKSTIVAVPAVKLPIADNLAVGKAKEKHLSEIIAEINSKTGQIYDINTTQKVMENVRKSIMQSEQFKLSAQNNTEDDFTRAYFRDIDNIFIEKFDEHKDLYTLLLSDEAVKRQIFGLIATEIYQSLRANR